MSRDNKANFMKTIREALGHPGNIRRQAPPGLFHSSAPEKSLRLIARTKSRTRAERRILFGKLVDAAKPINLDVCTVDTPKAAAAAIARKISDTPTEWGGSRQVCVWDHPLIDSLSLESVLDEYNTPVISCASFLSPSTQRLSEKQRTALRRAIINSYVGITAAEFCVADTATIVLRTRPGQPRSVSLVPSLHIAVITESQILEDLKELYAHLRWESYPRPADLTTCMTLVSGPSKTADIEATLVHGAHGPRALSLVVIAGENT